MDQPPSATSAAMRTRCPRCRRGPMFRYPPYHPRFQQMYADCPHCGLHYEVETGFFWGAMYINYGFIVGLLLAVFLPVLLLTDTPPPTWQIMGLYLGILLVLLPLLARYSRVVMLYLFGGIRFDYDAWARGRAAAGGA